MRCTRRGHGPLWPGVALPCTSFGACRAEAPLTMPDGGRSDAGPRRTLRARQLGERVYAGFGGALGLSGPATTTPDGVVVCLGMPDDA
jgi:hypothetical protein